MKNIAILAEDFEKWSGGRDFLQNLIIALSSVKDENITFYVFVPSNNSYKNFKGFKRNFYRIKTSLFPQYVITDSNETFFGYKEFKFVEYQIGSLQRILKKIKIDLIFPVTNPQYTKIDIPEFFYLFDCQHKYFPEFFSNKEIKCRDKNFLKIIKSGKKIIVNANSVKNDLTKFYSGKSDKICVLPFTPKIKQEYLEDNSDVVKKYNLPNRYFLISNQFWVHKDHSTAFIAFSQLSKMPEYADLQLICTGLMEDNREPKYIDKLKQLIKELEIEDKVHCLGLIPKIEQIEIMKGAVSVIQPTLFEGGPGGGCVSDAISLGVRSIVSNIETNIEIEDDLVVFFNKQDVFDLCKKMDTLLKTPKKKQDKEILLKKNNECTKTLGEFLINLIKEEIIITKKENLEFKEKICFIAHSYHKKTLSYVFIVDYLKQFYDIEILFDEKWETGKEIDWAALDNTYKAIIIFQMFPELEEDFKKITNNNVIYLPMYDQVEKWHFKKWYLCKNLKIVSFSFSLHKKLKRWGFNSIYVQYFIEPKEFLPGAGDEVFFWQRCTKININTLKKLFKNSDVKIHIHKTVDPGQSFVQPTKEDEERFKITYSEWFNTKEETSEIIKTKGIYIAPRFSEGIGMSFLEAMAQGRLIIANNKPTMNEYIKNGKTGFLCNFKSPKTIKILNIKEIQQNTYNFAKQGYEKWLLERKNIIDFINKEPIKNELNLWTKICLPVLFFDIRKIIRFKFGPNANLTLFGIKIFKT